jgi:hypothetical protein
MVFIGIWECFNSHKLPTDCLALLYQFWNTLGIDA